MEAQHHKSILNYFRYKEIYISFCFYIPWYLRWIYDGGNPINSFRVIKKLFIDFIKKHKNSIFLVSHFLHPSWYLIDPKLRWIYGGQNPIKFSLSC
jgi:hypothetical protein